MGRKRDELVPRAVLIALLLVLAVSLAHGETVTGPVRGVDGDTLEFPRTLACGPVHGLRLSGCAWKASMRRSSGSSARTEKGAATVAASR